MLQLSLLTASLLLPAAFVGDEQPRPVKIVAQFLKFSDRADITPVDLSTEGRVFRSAEQLVAGSGKAGSSKDPAVQMELEAEVAKLLKVEAIDWSKHMIVGAIVDSFDTATIDGKVMTITYVPFKERPTRSVHPLTRKVLILIERFPGEVKLVAKKQVD